MKRLTFTLFALVLLSAGCYVAQSEPRPVNPAPAPQPCPPDGPCPDPKPSPRP